MKSIRVLLMLIVWAVATQAQPSHTSGPIVSTQAGQIAGVLRDGVLAFRGIPYAQAPTGDRRWAPPQRLTPQQGLLQATHAKPACPQEARFSLTEASDNEDCLYLDISVPVSTGSPLPAGLPVIVWIHGGAFLGGSSSLYRLDPLARQTNAVVVAFNYRLGVFGFLAHPDLNAVHNGSFGLADQQLALRWIKENIAAFGGDPDNVTLMGESAGAAAVCTLLRAPELSAGLFDKAVILSTACVYPWKTVQAGNDFGLKIAEAVGCHDRSTALACLRQQNTMTLIKAASALPNPDPTPLAPVTGTPGLPTETAKAFQRRTWQPMPLLMGNTRDELRLYIGYEAQAGRQVTPDNYLAWLQFFYGPKASAVLQAYPLAQDSSPSATLGAAVSAFKPGFIVSQCLTLGAARLASDLAPVYVMDFADRTTPKAGVLIAATPDPKFELGATHSTPLSYLFPGFSSTRAMDAPPLSAASQATANQLMDYLAAFIRTGDPNGGNRLLWPRFNGATESAMRFDEVGVHVVTPATDYQCDFWKKLYPEDFRRLTEPQ